MHARELGGDGDHEDPAVGLDLDAGNAPSAPERWSPQKRAARGSPSVALGERLERRLLLLAWLLGNVDREAVMDVAALGRRPAREFRRPLAAQTLDAAGLRPGFDAKRFRTVERRDLHLRAEDGLGDAQRHLHLEVVALSLEHGRGGDVCDQVEVAGGSALAAGLTLSGEADATALADAGWDVHAQALDRAQCAGAMAGGRDPRSRCRSRRRANRAGRWRTCPDPRSRSRGPRSAGRPTASSRALRRCRDRYRRWRAWGPAAGPARPARTARRRWRPAPRDRRRARRASAGERPRAPPEAPAAPPKRLERMSPMEEPSKSKLPNPPNPPPGPAPVVKGPLPLSYCFRFSGSPSTSCAWEISLKRASAFLSSGLASG